MTHFCCNLFYSFKKIQPFKLSNILNFKLSFVSAPAWHNLFYFIKFSYSFERFFSIWKIPSSASHFILSIIWFRYFIFILNFPYMAHFLLYLKDPRQRSTFLWLAFGFKGISISYPRGLSLLLNNYFKHLWKSLIHPRKT